MSFHVHIFWCLQVSVYITSTCTYCNRTGTFVLLLIFIFFCMYAHYTYSLHARTPVYSQVNTLYAYSLHALTHIDSQVKYDNNRNKTELPVAITKVKRHAHTHTHLLEFCSPTWIGLLLFRLIFTTTGTNIHVRMCVCARLYISIMFRKSPLSK